MELAGQSLPFPDNGTAFENQNSSDCEDDLSGKLCVAQTIQTEYGIEDKQCWNFQNNLTQDRKQEGFASHADCLENTDSQEVDGQKWKSEAESAQQMRTVFDDGFVLHEHLNKGSREEEEQSCDRDNDGERCFAGKIDGVSHTRNISAGVVVADQRHNSLGNTLGNIHRHHIDLLADTHCSNSVRTISGGEVVEDGHASNVEQVLDGSRNADCTDTGDDILFRTNFFGLMQT